MADKSIIERALNEFPKVMPASMAIEILGMTYSEYRYKVVKRKISVGKGANRTDSFIFKYGIDDFAWLTDDYRKRYRAAWKAAAFDYTRKLCKIKLKSDDCSPAEFLEATNLEIPGIVAQELFGLSEKAVTRIRKLLGLILDPAKTRTVVALFFIEDSVVHAPECLSTNQLKRFDAITAKLKETYKKNLQEISLNAANNLWATMIKNKLTSSDPLHTCHGIYCQTQWPRNDVCYYKTTDTPDRLQDICKFCTLRYRQERPKRKQKRKAKHTKHLSETEHNYVSSRLKILYGNVPTVYLLELFGITLKQFTRIACHAELETNVVGRGNKLLQTWRAREEIESIEFISEVEMPRLKSIWSKDVKSYIDSLRKKDEEDTKILAQEMDRICAIPPSQRNVSFKHCEGGCGKSYCLDKFFFPNSAGRFKFFCVVCNRKRQRPKVFQYQDDKGA